MLTGTCGCSRVATMVNVGLVGGGANSYRLTPDNRKTDKACRLQDLKADECCLSEMAQALN